jgi:glycosyltransferase involved in cell wall biosynthesis
MEIMTNMNTERNICIVSPNKDVYSETFIRAHIERLPANVMSLYGYPLPNYFDEDGVLYSSSSSVNRIYNVIGQRFFNLSDKALHEMAVKKFLIKNKVDIVLAEYGHTGVAVMEICKEVNIPLIVHFHGHDAYRKNILNSVGEKYPKLFKIAAGLIVVSQDMRDQLIKLGAPVEKTIVNPYGVDISQFKGGNPLKAPIIFVAVGRFVDKKAPYLTLLAFNELLASFPESRLIMLGDGPLLEACIQLSQALSISHAIDFRGSSSHLEVAESMRLSRAFVQHSIVTGSGDSEGTPVAVIEASAVGLPVVATRHAGIKDVIVDGETGFLVAERDIMGMAESMKMLAKDPKLAAKLGKEGRERVKNDFSMDDSIGRLWNVIQREIKSNQ